MIRKHYNLFDMIKQPWYECFSSIFFWVQTFFEPVQNFQNSTNRPVSWKRIAYSRLAFAASAWK